MSFGARTSLPNVWLYIFASATLRDVEATWQEPHHGQPSNRLLQKYAL